MQHVATASLLRREQGRFDWLRAARWGPGRGRAAVDDGTNARRRSTCNLQEIDDITEALRLHEYQLEQMGASRAARSDAHWHRALTITRAHAPDSQDTNGPRMKIIILIALGLAVLAAVVVAAFIAIFCITGAASLERLEDRE